MKDNKKSKLREISETIFYGFLALAFLACVCLGFLKLLQNNLRLSLVIICPILTIIILLYISIKRDEKRAKEYRDKYISEIIVKDKVFGEIKFQHDTHKNELTCKNFKIPFGQYDPQIRIDAYEEKDLEIYLRNLEYVYSKSEEIIDNLLKEFSDGKENFMIESISIEKCGDYFLEDVVLIADAESEDFEGNPEDLVVAIVGNKDKHMSTPVAYMDCKTKKICYVLEG